MIPVQIVEDAVADDLSRCTPAQRALFSRLSVSPMAISCHAAEFTGEVTAVARTGDRVIWYEPVHEAFEITLPDSDGTLRPIEWGQFELTHILFNLLDEAG